MRSFILLIFTSLIANTGFSQDINDLLITTENTINYLSQQDSVKLNKQLLTRQEFKGFIQELMNRENIPAHVLNEMEKTNLDSMYNVFRLKFIKTYSSANETLLNNNIEPKNIEYQETFYEIEKSDMGVMAKVEILFKANNEIHTAKTRYAFINKRWVLGKELNFPFVNWDVLCECQKNRFNYDYEYENDCYSQYEIFESKYEIASKEEQITMETRMEPCTEEGSKNNPAVEAYRSYGETTEDEIAMEEQHIEVNQEEIYDVPQKQAQFPNNDMEGFYQYLSENIQYPKMAKQANIQGKVYIQFVVEKDGSISNVKVLRGIGANCDEEAIRVIKNMPNWIPGEHDGELIRSRMILPIKFELTIDEKENIEE